MIFTQENEYSAVLDACVLVPAALCDTLLRLAEEPALYRPLWSDPIMAEMAKALRTKLHRTPGEIEYRKRRMNEAFPEAMIHFPPDLIAAVQCIPDNDDRHVLAAAIMARADTIVTQNIRHFPRKCTERFNVLCQTADDFLMQQYHLSREIVLDKIDGQAADLNGADRASVVAHLRAAAPGFCDLLTQHL